MIYLIILVLVAVLGIARLWHQQRKEQSQLDTIDGFSSALEAIKPEMPAPRRSAGGRRRSAGAAPRDARAVRARSAPGGTGRKTRRRISLVASLRSWFVAEPRSVPSPSPEVLRKVEARRRARAAAVAEGRRSVRRTAPHQRDIAYETLDLTDERVALPERRVGPHREMVGAGQSAYSMRMRNPG